MKAIVLLKRRSGMSHEQFRQYYETSHVELAHKYLGHLFLDYRRNYPEMIDTDAEGNPLPAFAQSPYDAITEIRYKDREAFLESQRIMSDPEIGKLFAEDEKHFMDGPAFRIFTCDVVISPADVLQATA